jgi:hypothetical protein
MRWFLIILGAAAAAGTAGAQPQPDSQPEFRIEQLPVAGGGDLLTVIGHLPGQSDDVPMLSVLRDTLGDQDPENDRLRYVWVLSSARPSLLNRAAGSLPFFYWRPDFGKNADRRPVPVIDLGAASRGVWTSLAGQLTQVLALDPEGALVRSSTRSYRNNLEDHRRVHLLEALALLSQIEDRPDVKALLSEPELVEMQTRLALAGQTMGGLVGAEKLPGAYVKQRTHSEELRGHNWELLRQRAEANGLYFQPLGFNGSATHALLWIATADLAERKWDGQFLGIADPYRDPRLRKWAGYREVRDGREMIPLGLYALEYPKVPLLLVDFRDTHAPKRREMIRHAATDTIVGVLGISQWGNWPYMAGAWTFNFVRERHGDANNRAARLKAYSEVREWLALDGSLDPGLRADLRKRLEILGVNPMEESVFAEAQIAQRQYAALIKYAQDPHGLPARLEHDRRAELIAYEHGAAARAGMQIATVATLGLYSPEKIGKHSIDTEALYTKLDQHRRIAKETSFLASVARSSPQTDIVWNMDEVRHAVDQLASTGMPARSAQVVQQIMQRTTDEETRALCQRALQGLNASLNAGLE